MSYRRTFLFFVILLQEGRASSRIANILEGFYGCRAHTFIRIGKSFDERRNCLRCIRKTFLEKTYPKPLTHNGTEETARKGNRAGLQRRHNIRNCSLVSDVIHKRPSIFGRFLWVRDNLCCIHSDHLLSGSYYRIAQKAERALPFLFRKL